MVDETQVTVRLDLPGEALLEEQGAAGPHYELGPATPLPPDPDAVEAHFVDPITLIAVVTVAMLAWRIVNHYLVRDGRGVLVDARRQPPVVSRLEDVPAGFILLIKPDGSTETVDSGKIDDSALADLLKPLLKSAA